MVARRRLGRQLLSIVALYCLGALIAVALHLLLQMGPLGRDVERMLARVDWNDETLALGKATVRFAMPGLAGVIAFAIWDALRNHRTFERKLREEGRTVLLLPKADQRPTRVDRIRLWGRIAQVIPASEHIAFELSGGQLGMGFYLRAMPRTLRYLLPQIMAEWSGVRAVYAEEEPDEVREEQATWWVEVCPSSAIEPIQPASNDPLAAVLAAIARLPERVTGGLHVCVRPDPFAPRRIRRAAASRASAPSQPVSPEARREIRRRSKELSGRASRGFLEIRLVVSASASDARRARSSARSLARTLVSQFEPSNRLRIVRQGASSHDPNLFPLFSGWPWAENELAMIGHLVGQEARAIAPQLRVAPAKPLPPAPDSRVPQEAATKTK